MKKKKLLGLLVKGGASVFGDVLSTTANLFLKAKQKIQKALGKTEASIPRRNSSKKKHTVLNEKDGSKVRIHKDLYKLFYALDTLQVKMLHDFTPKNEACIAQLQFHKDAIMDGLYQEVKA